MAFLVGLTAVQSNAQSNKAETESLLIRGGWLLDGVSDTRRHNSGILIRDGKIVDIDIQTDADPLSHSEIIELADSDTILPGMIMQTGN